MTNSTFRSGSVSHFRNVMHAFSLSGVDLVVHIPTPRCITSFSPPANTGYGRDVMDTFSEVLSGYVTVSE